MARILFVNPPAREAVYLNTNVSVAAPLYPNLTLATLAGHLVKGHDIRVVDLDLPGSRMDDFWDVIREFNPDLVASSAKTHDYPVVKELFSQLKQKVPGITTVIGGVHVTSRPQEVSREKCFDIMALGEADTVIPELLAVSSPADVPGIVYRVGFQDEVKWTPRRESVADLNQLPYPAWELFDIRRYSNSRLSSRLNPVGLIETSRGCAAQCNFCNKLVFGSRLRVKAPRRVVDEMEYMLRCGFREIHIVDDSFTQDIDRAKEICREILRRKVKFPWALINGVRVNMVDAEFFKLAKRAGCWLVGFGIESGDQKVLDRVNKKTTIEQIRVAVGQAHKEGLDTFGFFIFGLSGETEESLERTIAFAQSLPLDIAKFDICIPYPGTKYYEELESQGRIRSYEWSKYICHQTKEPLYDHPDLSWETIERYYHDAFRAFYLRPVYFFRRFWRSLKRGDLLFDILYFFKAKW